MMSALGRRLLAPFLCLLLAPALAGAAPVASTPATVAGYIPEEVAYDPDVPTPSSALGFPVGEWHVRPDQVVDYFRRLAETSPRVEIEIQGRTHEERPQILLLISSPENLERRDEIRARHRAVSEPGEGSTGGEPPDLPVVVWLAYSIHGDEASGTNAALVVAYHLAAARGPEVETLLDDTIVLLDPMLNPDGLGRFATWVNMHRGRVPAGDPLHREHEQGWPSGRGNHYWFDLNRDWLLLVHPESRNRVETFQRWRPHVVADFHEMGRDRTYFFQPGVPSRTHPLTPERNQELTGKLARFHAEALDRSRRLYYHAETYDDFYYGKGSTYPDIQGSVGVLFEQASVEGHRQETDYGVRRFAFAIQNHVLASLSTLRGAAALSGELRRYQREFYREAIDEAARSDVGGWLCSTAGAPVRSARFVDLLTRHGIELYDLPAPISLEEETYRPGETLVVPVEQRQARLLEALFERRSDFPDSTFYDVSTWTLPLAFDLPCRPVSRKQWKSGWRGAPRSGRPRAETPVEVPRSEIGYLLDWTRHDAPRALYALQEEKVRAQVVTRPTELRTDEGLRELLRGTVVVTEAIQPEEVGDLSGLVQRIGRETGVPFLPLESGLSPDGPDLGSPSLPPLERPRPAIVVGDGASPYESGALWHLLDHEWRIEVALVEGDALPGAELERFTHLFLVDGSTETIGDDTTTSILEWIRGGGILVTTKGAARWAGEELLSRAEEKGAGEGPGQERSGQSPEEKAAEEGTPKSPDAGGEESGSAGEEPGDGPVRLPYGEYEERRAAVGIAGAIFETTLDRTHPLAFGFPRNRVPVFRRGTWIMEPSENPFENVALYTDRPWLSGYVTDERLEEMAGSGAALASRVGEGAVIRLADDPDFRGFWLATQRFVANALFFAPQIRETSAPSTWTEPSRE
ncbi:MAG: M14 family zinc carboxypeptidase [Thermoanaerobaculia bacterium]|nr:M14 family zinc carboxypeptidase [Thermoanaerobaculia bacterium]